MQKFILSNIDKTVNDIFDNGESLCFRKTFPLFKVGTEVSLRAKLGYDVAMGGLAYNFIASEDVRMFQFGQCLDLAI